MLRFVLIARAEHDIYTRIIGLVGDMIGGIKPAADFPPGVCYLCPPDILVTCLIHTAALQKSLLLSF